MESNGSNGSVWDEHNDEAGSGQAADHDVLNAVSDAAVLDEAAVEDEPPKKKGPNLRLLFVIFVLVAGSLAGFMFFKMIKRPASQEDVQASYQPPPAAEPAPPAVQEIQQPVAPVEPVQPVSSQDKEPLAADAAIAAMNEQLNAQLQAGQTPQQPPAVAGLPVVPQPAAPPQQDNSEEIAQLRSTINGLQHELSKVKEDLAQANKVKSAPAPAVSKTAAVSERTSRPAPAPRARSKPVITEDRSALIADASIRAIYPVSGKNPQAWVAIGGDLKEVSVGGVINGAKVRSINAETMEIVTDAGTIRARRN